MKSLKSWLPAGGGSENAKYPSVLPFLEDILKADKGETTVIALHLYLRNYSIKAEYAAETDSWTTVLDDDCESKIVLTIETNALISGSPDKTGVFSVEKREKPIRPMSRNLSRAGSGLSRESSVKKSASHPLNPNESSIDLALHHTTTGEGVVWIPMTASDEAFENRLVAEGYEKAASVEGNIRLSALLEYFKLCQYKLFSRYVREVPDLARVPGVYTERYYCTEMLVFASNLASTQTDNSKVQNRTKFRTFPLSKELQIITPSDSRFSKDVPNFTRKY